MSEDPSLDLSGDWLGVFSYPRDLPPVSFSAALSDEGGRLAGAVAEANGQFIAAIEGRRTGRAVTWLKSYEHREVHHDVQYEGEVSDDGEEISGRWSIFQDWSGTFLMVRQPRPGQARQGRQSASRSE